MLAEEDVVGMRFGWRTAMSELNDDGSSRAELLAEWNSRVQEIGRGVEPMVWYLIGAPNDRLVALGPEEGPAEEELPEIPA